MKLLNSLLLLSLICVSAFAHTSTPFFHEETKVLLDKRGESLMIKGSWEILKGSDHPNSFVIRCYKSSKVCFVASSNLVKNELFTDLTMFKITEWSKWFIQMENIGTKKALITFDVKTGSVMLSFYEFVTNDLTLNARIKNLVTEVERY